MTESYRHDWPYTVNWTRAVSKLVGDEEAVELVRYYANWNERQTQLEEHLSVVFIWLTKQDNGLMLGIASSMDRESGLYKCPISTSTTMVLVSINSCKTKSFQEKTRRRRQVRFRGTEEAAIVDVQTYENWARKAFRWNDWIRSNISPAWYGEGARMCGGSVIGGGSRRRDDVWESIPVRILASSHWAKVVNNRLNCIDIRVCIWLVTGHHWTHSQNHDFLTCSRPYPNSVAASPLRLSIASLQYPLHHGTLHFYRVRLHPPLKHCTSHFVPLLPSRFSSGAGASSATHLLCSINVRTQLFRSLGAYQVPQSVQYLFSSREAPPSGLSVPLHVYARHRRSCPWIAFLIVSSLLSYADFKSRPYLKVLPRVISYSPQVTLVVMNVGRWDRSRW